MASKKVGTIVLSKVDPDIVKHYLAEFGLSTDGSIEELVQRLIDYESKTPKQFIGDCDECNGACDIRLPVCCYCGAGDTEGEIAAAVVANPNATVEPATKPRKSSRSQSIAAVGPTTMQTVGDLDRNVKRIQDLKKDAVVSYWRLGKAIYENFEGRLYTLRLQDGEPKYKSFNQFVAAELGLSVSHAYKLMDVSVNFNEEEVATYGVAKLALVARMPDSERGELLDRIRATNVPLSQVAEEVRRLAGGRRTDTAAIQGGRGSVHSRVVTGDRPAPKSQVTVGIVLGKKTIQLMRKEDPDRSAMTIQHDPVCDEQMLNGVVTSYRIIKNEIGLALVITRTREKEAPKEPKAAKSKGRPASTAPSSGEAPPAKRGRGRPRKNPIQ